MEGLTKQKLHWILQMAIVLIVGIVIGWESKGMWDQRAKEIPLERNPEGQMLENATIIDGNSLKAHRINYIDGQILGSLGEGVPTRIITGYNAVPEQTDDTPFITASGLDLRKSTKQICASNEFPFGTEIKIIGLGECEIQDRTNDRYGYRIDWLFETVEEALAFGRRTLEIEIL